jgi:hypothetical protein
VLSHSGLEKGNGHTEDIKAWSNLEMQKGAAHGSGMDGACKTEACSENGNTSHLYSMWVLEET